MREFHLGSRHRFAAATGPRAYSWAVVLALGLLVAKTSLAGSYLDRAALLLAQAAHETNYVRTHLTDKELARMVEPVARARLKAAQEMQIPKEVAPAHPHLLLVLGAHERAVAAAVEGQVGRFLERLQRARDEEAILRSVLKELGWALPKG
jgi:hypothetical protein